MTDDNGDKITELLHGNAKANDLLSNKYWKTLKNIEQKPNTAKKIKKRLLFLTKNNEIKYVNKNITSLYESQ